MGDDAQLEQRAGQRSGGGVKVLQVARAEAGKAAQHTIVILARHRQAHTAEITDATLSEVAKLAQIKLYYSSNSPAYVRSHTALLSIIQAVAYGVYAQDTAQYDDQIKAFRLK